MIFVTLGTQDKTFERLLIEIDRLIEKKVINDEIIVQAGNTVYKSKNMEIFDFIDMKNFDVYIRKCDILITHGGVGSILNGIDNQKKVLAVARLEKYDEHENDHQIQIISEFVKRNLIVGCLEVDQLEEKILELSKFESIGYDSNNNQFCRLVENLIEK